MGGVDLLQHNHRRLLFATATWLPRQRSAQCKHYARAKVVTKLRHDVLKIADNAAVRRSIRYARGALFQCNE